MNRATVLLLIILGAGILAYLSSFSGDFVFDDRPHILVNESVRDLSDLGAVLGGTRRPVVNLSLAVNYALDGGSDTQLPGTFTFHLFNLLVHLATATVLFLLIRYALQLRPGVAATAALWIAFAVALLWVVHPLTTAAVTYIIQRAEALMALFYLVALYAVLRCASGRRVWLWAGIAMVSSVLCMYSKAVGLTLPVGAVLIDRCLVTGSFMQTLRQRWWLFTGLAATWSVLFFTGLAQGVLNPAHTGPATVGFAVDSISPLEYFLTQPQVILHYLRLSLLPVGLTLDYAWPVTGGVTVSLFVVMALGLLAVWLLWKRPALGFVAAMFFLVLGPTSSVVPMDDLANDHRMYLPLVSVIVLVVIGLWRVLGGRGQQSPRVFVTAVGLAAFLFATGTVIRNLDYADAKTMWQDVLEKRPRNPRAHLHVGVAELANVSDAALSMAERQAAAARAVERFQTAIELDPTYVEAHINLGSTLGSLGRTEQAIVVLETAVELDQREYQAAYLLGVAYRQQGRSVDAQAMFERVLSLQAQHVFALNQYGLALMDSGDRDAAAVMFERAVNAPASTAAEREEQNRAKGNLARAQSG